MASIIELNQGWSCIMTGINKLKKILEEEPETAFNTENQMTVYTTVYEMCIQKSPHNYSKELYDKCLEEIKNYNEQTVLPSLRKKHDESMLRELVKRWNNHKILVGWLSHLFEYVDRYFVGQKELRSLKESNLACFRDLVYHEFQSEAKDVLLALIRKEREGEQIDRALLQDVIDVYIENGMGELEKYEKDFESFMLKDTESYYSRKALKWIQEDSCPDYMLKCENCLKKEKERVTHYFHLNTAPKLVQIVHYELLVEVVKQLLENEHSGYLALLREGKMDDLSRMYRLYRPILQVLEALANALEKHVTAEGNALIKQATDTATDQAASTGGVQEKSWLQVLTIKVIELHDKYTGYVTQCFQNSNLFRKALNKAFEIFCNKTVAGDSFEKVLATFCDNILTKGRGSETLSDEAIKQTFEKVTKLLAYISDKDLFAEFYRKNQARRLLSDRSVSEYHERSILLKFKQELGEEFTSKMTDMVLDMTRAKNIQNEFMEYLTPDIRANLGFDLTVTVLKTNLWPSYKTSDLNLPDEMVKCVEVFNEFYETTTEHKKISWIYSLGTCLIVGNFDEKQIELTVSTYQAAVLLLFNNTEKLSYTEILEQLNLSHEDLVRVLHSLSCANYKILKKEPMSRTISNTDTFEFNSKFTDKMQGIKVPLPLMDERKKVVEDVDNDRRYTIEAAIVRIMKSRKVLEYPQLVSECVNHLSHFKPDIKIIKQRTENLITREYLERDPDNPNNLKYLA